MKVHLMYREQDVDLDSPLPETAADLEQDLELNVLLTAMARGDRVLHQVAERQLVQGTKDLATIRYRQGILRDCLKRPTVLRELYRIAVDTDTARKQGWFGVHTRYPTAVLSGAIARMEAFIGLLRRLRRIADEHGDEFESEGFCAFFTLLRKELDDAYFRSIDDHLNELKFRRGVLISARLGRGNEPEGFVLRKAEESGKGRVREALSRKAPSYSFAIDPRDDSGARALGELRDTGLNLVANAVAQSADHVDDYLRALRIELAFYLGCLNLYEDLQQFGCDIAFPVPEPAGASRFAVHELYDVCLALTLKRKIEGNNVDAGTKNLVIITGANQGGKSVFLRSVGLAQLMMQAGMFVAAQACHANVCRGLFTHFRREEDASMTSGKLDEELGRMSALVNHLVPGSMILFNESFAATNEREGSEIATQITETLLEKGIKVFSVTHLYTYAHAFYQHHRAEALFLRAQRKAEGERSFKLLEGEPLETSYGEDVYDAVYRADQP